MKDDFEERLFRTQMDVMRENMAMEKALIAIRNIVSEHSVEPSIYDGDDRSLGRAEGAFDLAEEIRKVLP